MKNIQIILFILSLSFHCLAQDTLKAINNFRFPEPNFNDTTWYYHLSFLEKNSGFFLYIDCAMHTGNVISDGVIKNNDLLFVSDSSIVTLKANKVIPKSKGSTYIYLLNPDNPTFMADSILVTVSKSNGNFTIESK